MNAYVTERRVTDKRAVVGVATGLLLVAMLLASLMIAQPANAKSAALIKKAPLSGSSAFPSVNGEAKWKSKGGERELEIQIQDATKLAGKRLSVRIGGKLVGHMKVSALGRARLVKSTQAGQSVPASVAGKAVKISTAGGSLVASGRF